MIYKLCTACLGEGAVERPVDSKTVITLQKDGMKEKHSDTPGVVKCYVCQGRLILPSGYFILDDGEEFFLDELQKLSPEERQAIINRT